MRIYIWSSFSLYHSYLKSIVYINSLYIQHSIVRLSVYTSVQYIQPIHIYISLFVYCKGSFFYSGPIITRRYSKSAVCNLDHENQTYE